MKRKNQIILEVFNMTEQIIVPAAGNAGHDVNAASSIKEYNMAEYYKKQFASDVENFRNSGRLKLQTFIQAYMSLVQFPVLAKPHLSTRQQSRLQKLEHMYYFSVWNSQHWNLHQRALPGLLQRKMLMMGYLHCRLEDLIYRLL